MSLGATSFNDNNITNVENIALDSLTAADLPLQLQVILLLQMVLMNDIASHDTSNGLKLGSTLVTATALTNSDGVIKIQTQLNNAATTGKAIAMAMVFG